MSYAAFKYTERMLCVVFVFVHHPEIDINANIMLRDLLCPELLKHIVLIFFKSLSHRVLILGGTQTYNFLIFGQAPKPSCLGVRQGG